MERWILITIIILVVIIVVILLVTTCKKGTNTILPTPLDIIHEHEIDYHYHHEEHCDDECCDGGCCHFVTIPDACDVICTRNFLRPPEITSFNVTTDGTLLTNISSLYLTASPPEPDGVYVNMTWASINTSQYTFYMIDWDWMDRPSGQLAEHQAWVMTQGELGAYGGFGQSHGSSGLPIAVERCQPVEFTLTTISFARESPVSNSDIIYNPSSQTHQANVTWARIVYQGCEAKEYWVFFKTTLETPGGDQYDYFAPVQISETSITITYDVAPPGTYIDHQCRVLAMFNCSLNDSRTVTLSDPLC